MEAAYPEPEPAPLTTIAWRLAHLTVACFGQRAASHFGGPPTDFFGHDYAATAEHALADLDRAYADWCTGLGTLGEGGLERQVGPAEGPFAAHSFAGLVLHVNREAIHHGAEILLLRDLYARTR